MAEQHTHPPARRRARNARAATGRWDDALLGVAVSAGSVWATVSEAGAVGLWAVTGLAVLEIMRRRGLWSAFADRVLAVPLVPSHLPRPGDLPVILILAWTGWLALPWGISPAAAQSGQSAGVTAPSVSAKPSAASRTSAPRDVYHEVAARAARQERMRIASEVHDAAGHGLAAIAMQAGLALLMFDERPEQARESLEAIRATSTRALADLRAALDTMSPPPESDLHATPPPPATAREAAPQPLAAAGPYGLWTLAETVRAGGLPVDLEVAEPDGPVPAHLGAAVHRVVQESLTNVMRHAGPTRAVVRVAQEPSTSGDLVVEVTDRGWGSTAALPAEGRGMAGMRARVEAAGGRFTAGPREGGGFRVVARFPRPAA
ncbi:sensor histidine kinase [Spongiactinospora rosea]|uniref:histidine kinase n=1 Tax=Spongiactinospora rosea TaxID=2248750 RepID=A0A366M7V6_9ACTN|nr:sensor histidine kinase [Spongiactinospora rosea]RBQ21810.1 sensor histidine kinase [Spongiactinospora rosea]